MNLHFLDVKGYSVGKIDNIFYSGDKITLTLADNEELIGVFGKFPEILGPYNIKGIMSNMKRLLVFIV